MDSINDIMHTLYSLLGPVNGGWGQWSDWTACSATCDGGQKIRARVCDSPAPQTGGDDCTADGSSSRESQACNTESCAGMHILMLDCFNAYMFILL